MLTMSVAFEKYRPDVDLGYHPDQTVMETVFNETGVRSGIVYQPRPWVNTYEFLHGYEGKKGDMLVHFPGMEGERWKHMSDWLDIIETKPREWAMPLEDTDYPVKIAAYWEELKQARLLMQRAASIAQRTEMQASYDQSKNRDVINAIARLQFVMESEADTPGSVKTAMKELQDSLRDDSDP